MPFNRADHGLFMGVVTNDPSRVVAAVRQGANPLRYPDDLDPTLPFRNSLEHARLLGHQAVLAVLLEMMRSKAETGAENE